MDTSLGAFREDIRHAVRRLARTPLFAVTVSATLALGLGSTTALFSLADALLLRPLAVRDADRLVVLYTTSREGVELVAYPDFQEYRRSAAASLKLAAHYRQPLSVMFQGASERVWGEAVSANYFDVVLPPMALGGGFDAASDGAGQAVLSHALWQRSFGGRRDVLGTSIQVAGYPFVVVGVAGPGFHGTNLELGMGSRTALWLTLSQLALLDPNTRTRLEFRDRSLYGVVGRLAHGVDRTAAESSLRAIAAHMAASHPDTNRDRGATLVSARVGQISPATRRAVRAFLATLAGGAAFLLLAACVNVAHLQLARGAARSGELAVRAALGAGRLRLMRELGAECALLSLVGFLLSLPVAFATQRLLVQFSLPFATPLDYELRLDLRALAVAALLGSLALVGAGLLPLLRTTRLDLRGALHGVGHTATRRPRLGHLLLGLQVALSLTLLVGAGLFARSLERASRVSLGFRVEDVLVMNVDFNADRHRFEDARARRFYLDSLERVRALPGVRSAAWAGDIPLGIRQLIIGFFPEPRERIEEAQWQTLFCDVVSTGYFETLGIPVRGRAFRERDDADTPPVAVVNEALARRHWPGRDAIGQRFKVRGRGGVKMVEVIGVAGDVRQRSLREAALPRAYFPLRQRHFPEMSLHVRVAGEPRDHLAGVRAALAAVEPDLPVFAARPMRDQVKAALSQMRMGGALLGASALLTLLLATVGTSGVAARSAADRRREMGIRIALGAVPRQVLGLVLRQNALPVASGLALGSAVALGLARGLESFLFDVHTADAPTFAASAAALAAVAAVALYVPARRSAALDPSVVLRHE
jgi:predicted permease